jgi:hypothetical protein
MIRDQPLPDIVAALPGKVPALPESAALLCGSVAL